MAHARSNRSLPDRRGGPKNQPKPRTSEHHTHIMVPWGSDARFTRCDQLGCQYAEVNGKPVIGHKERSREYVPVEMFPQDEMDVTRFGRQMEWG